MRESSHPLAFMPVPLARRRFDGWTWWRQARFILTLNRIGHVGAAAKAVGRSRKSAYALRRRAGAESFAAAWDRALHNGRGRVRDTAVERALHGEARPVFYRGRQVGERRVYDHRLIIAVLRATRPEYAASHFDPRDFREDGL
jgi:hypothetical protein